MMSYKDRTYCSSEVEEHTCGRELTKPHKANAILIGIPVAYGDFCTTPTEREELKGVVIDNSPRGRLVSLLGSMALDSAKPWVDELISHTREEAIREGQERALKVISNHMGWEESEVFFREKFEQARTLPVTD